MEHAFSSGWWGTPVALDLERPRQEDFKLETSLSYIVSPCLYLLQHSDLKEKPKGNTGSPDAGAELWVSGNLMRRSYTLLTGCHRTDMLVR